jgi:hypothetical protein
MTRPSPPPAPDLGPFCQAVLERQLRRANEMSTTLHVPQLRDHVMEHPDLMIGLKGAGRLEFIHEHSVVELEGRPRTIHAAPSGDKTPLA